MSAQLFDGSMTKQTRPRFSPEFWLDAAQLVLDQSYTVKKAADAMGVGKSTMGKWAQQLRRERQGQPFKGSPMTPDQKRIKELEKRVRDPVSKLCYSFDVQRSSYRYGAGRCRQPAVAHLLDRAVVKAMDLLVPAPLPPSLQATDTRSRDIALGD